MELELLEALVFSQVVPDRDRPAPGAAARARSPTRSLSLSPALVTVNPNDDLPLARSRVAVNNRAFTILAIEPSASDK